MKFKDIFINWWKDHHSIKKYNSVTIVSSMSDIPVGSLANNIYLINRNNKNRWVVFDCPSGHGKRIEVNLMQITNPSWKITLNNKKISLYPSVAVDDSECDCHFWLKNNIAYKAAWFYEN